MAAGATRDYGRLLEAAETLTFGGYLDTEGRREQAKARDLFRSEVRNLVYDLFRESPDHGPLAYSVSADLDRIAAAGGHSEAAVAEARAVLLAEIGKRSRNSPATRFLIRWVPPALGLLGVAAWVYFKTSFFS
jgi:hypothetical protein